MSHRRIQQMMQANAQSPTAILDTLITSLNPKLWVEARKEISYNNSDAVPVLTGWDSVGINLTQGSAAYQPIYVTNIINGQPAFFFDETDDIVSVSGAGFNSLSALTIVMVQVASHNGVANSDTGLCRVTMGVSTSGFWSHFGNTSFFVTECFAFTRYGVALGISVSKLPIINSGDRLLIEVTHTTTSNTITVNGSSLNFDLAYGVTDTSDITPSSITGMSDVFSLNGINSVNSGVYGSYVPLLLIFPYDISADLPALRTAINNVYGVY